MKGVIKEGIQEFVEARFGKEIWHKVSAAANCDGHLLSVEEDLPDEMTADLVSALSEASGMPSEEILIEFANSDL